MEQAKQFLEALFAGKSEQEYILLWLLDGRRSAWFQDTAAAAAFVDANRARDVYLGVALSPADHGPHLRLKIEGNERLPSSIVALWADIDIADAVHKKKNLAPTAEDARSILFPDIPPSILIHSGGGLQAWWLFREPWTLESEEEVRRAGALATRWIRAIRARAAARGWDIDSVGDLTRVLRVPDTSNCKIPGHPRPVRLIEINDSRYNPSDLTEYLDIIGADTVNPALPQVASGERLQYSADANPPFERFQVLCDNEHKFKATWDHLRKDMKDQTPSAYDMALANLAVQAGWTDQEIANLLIAHRRRYNEDLKLRDSYYAKTIAKARAAFSSTDLMQEIRELITPEPKTTRGEDGERKQEAPSQKDPLQQKAALVDRINRKLGLDEDHRIIRIKRYTCEPAKYELQTASGDIMLGGINGLAEWRNLYHHLLDVAAQIIPPFKKDEWADIAKALRQACVDVSVGEEGTDAGLVNSWLAAYLGTKPILEALDQTDETRSPFVRDGRIHIYMSDFRRWVHLNCGDKVAPKDMSTSLRRAGAVDTKVPHGKSTRQVWMLAESFVPPPKPQVPEWVSGEQADTVQ